MINDGLLPTMTRASIPTRAPSGVMGRGPVHALGMARLGGDGARGRDRRRACRRLTGSGSLEVAPLDSIHPSPRGPKTRPGWDHWRAGPTGRPRQQRGSAPANAGQRFNHSGPSRPVPGNRSRNSSLPRRQPGLTVVAAYRPWRQDVTAPSVDDSRADVIVPPLMHNRPASFRCRSRAARGRTPGRGVAPMPVHR